MELLIATKNHDKFKEINKLLKDLPLDIVSLNKFKDAPVVIEDGRTLESNAKKKAVEISRFFKKLVLADDSGLEVVILGNKPGVYSARFSGKGATYRSNNKKLLDLLKDVPSRKRKAVFRCVIALADRGKLIGIAEGRCNGSITFEPKGSTGFGYDPVFIPAGYRKTFAQMGIPAKNKISHRSRALRAAKKIIKRYILTLET